MTQAAVALGTKVGKYVTGEGIIWVRKICMLHTGNESYVKFLCVTESEVLSWSEAGHRTAA